MSRRKPVPTPETDPGIKLRAALYVRVSTRDKGQTVENQLPVLRAFALENNWEIVREFSDNDTASGKIQREGFGNMMASAQRREFDVLVFWSLDRFSREGSYVTLDQLQRLSTWGVRFKSYSEQFLDTCGIFREAIIALLAALAKQERIRLSERVRAGLARAKLQGRVGGKPRVNIDLARFERMNDVYNLRELMQHLQIGRSTVYDLRNRVKLAKMQAQEATNV